MATNVSVEAKATWKGDERFVEQANQLIDETIEKVRILLDPNIASTYDGKASTCAAVGRQSGALITRPTTTTTSAHHPSYKSSYSSNTSPSSAAAAAVPVDKAAAACGQSPIRRKSIEAQLLAMDVGRRKVGTTGNQRPLSNGLCVSSGRRSTTSESSSNSASSVRRRLSPVMRAPQPRNHSGSSGRCELQGVPSVRSPMPFASKGEGVSTLHGRQRTVTLIDSDVADMPMRKMAIARPPQSLESPSAVTEGVDTIRIAVKVAKVSPSSPDPPIELWYSGIKVAQYNRNNIN